MKSETETIKVGLQQIESVGFMKQRSQIQTTIISLQFIDHTNSARNGKTQ